MTRFQPAKLYSRMLFMKPCASSYGISWETTSNTYCQPVRQTTCMKKSLIFCGSLAYFLTKSR